MAVSPMNANEQKAYWITRDSMYVIRKKGADMQASFERIPEDLTTMRELIGLSRAMLEWDRTKTEELLKSASASKGLISFTFSDERPVEDLMREYIGYVRMVARYADPDGSMVFNTSSAHFQWRNPKSISWIAAFEDYIRDFSTSEEGIRKMAAGLQKEEGKALLGAFSKATRLREMLVMALDEYSDRFEKYVSEITKVCPGIFNRQDYCRKLDAAYGDSELDYEITPGNHSIVDHVGEYYRAYLLGRMYDGYESDGEVIAWSHRKLGWKAFEVSLEKECDLALLLKTNFGYGRSSYFMSTLRYRGVNAINASFIIYYSGQKFAQYADNTFNYPVSEEKFYSCFNTAVEIYEDYVSLGEAGFVDKYFRKPLSDLALMLNMVTKSKVFLDITSLDLFEQLTSDYQVELIPDEGFESIDPSLTGSQLAAIERIVDEVASGECDEPSLAAARESVERELASLRAHRGSSSLQCVIRQVAFRNQLAQSLRSKISDYSRAANVVNALVPEQSGAHVRRYDGYELAKIRSDKASSVISLIGHLEDIAEAAGFDGIVSSLKDSCTLIRSQDLEYISCEIEPRLESLLPEKDSLSAQLEEASGKLDALSKSGVDTSWISEIVAKTKADLNSVSAEISSLERQRKSLMQYIDKANRVIGDI